MADLRIWGIEVDAYPATAMVWPGTVPLLAALLDPAAPLVYCQQHAPMRGWSDPGWMSLKLPLTPARPLAPEVVKARFLAYDLLLSTSDYLQIAPELAEAEASVRQVQRPPDSGLQTHPAQRENWYRRFGLVVGFELPHKNEAAQVVAGDGELLDAALVRLREAS